MLYEPTARHHVSSQVTEVVHHKFKVLFGDAKPVTTEAEAAERSRALRDHLHPAKDSDDSDDDGDAETMAMRLRLVASAVDDMDMEEHKRVENMFNRSDEPERKAKIATFLANVHVKEAALLYPVFTAAFKDHLVKDVLKSALRVRFLGCVCAPSPPALPLHIACIACSPLSLAAHRHRRLRDAQSRQKRQGQAAGRLVRLHVGGLHVHEHV